MKYELRTLTSDEVIDVVSIFEGMESVGIEMAKAYFVNRKKLDEEDFDKLFTVKVKPSTVRYKWWEEESTKLDDY
jgi:hypothetical protein